MKKLFFILLCSFAFCGCSTATPVLFPLAQMFGTGSYNKPFRIEAVRPLITDGTNLFVGSYQNITPTGGTNPIAPLTPNDYLVTFQDARTPWRISVPLSTNVLNALTLTVGSLPIFVYQPPGSGGSATNLIYYSYDNINLEVGVVVTNQVDSTHLNVLIGTNTTGTWSGNAVTATTATNLSGPLTDLTVLDSITNSGVYYNPNSGYVLDSGGQVHWASPGNGALFTTAGDLQNTNGNKIYRSGSNALGVINGFALTNLSAANLNGKINATNLPPEAVTNNQTVVTFGEVKSILSFDSIDDNVPLIKDWTGDTNHLYWDASLGGFKSEDIWNFSDLGTTPLNASKLMIGAIPLPRLPPEVITNNASGKTLAGLHLASAAYCTFFDMSVSPLSLYLYTDSSGLLTYSGGDFSIGYSHNFIGGGASLSSLNASALSSGTVPWQLLGNRAVFATNIVTGLAWPMNEAIYDFSTNASFTVSSLTGLIPGTHCRPVYVVTNSNSSAITITLPASVRPAEGATNGLPGGWMMWITFDCKPGIKTNYFTARAAP